jgi:ketosteroid isomerase-like protein
MSLLNTFVRSGWGAMSARGWLYGALLIGAVDTGQAQSPPPAESARAEQLEALGREVASAERAFARTMADRNLEAFAGFVAESAVFRDGPHLLIGRAAVRDGWRALFKPGPAPFSWEPDRVTVSDSGATAVSSGPVRDAAGKMIGRFTTVWQKQIGSEGERWRVIVDQGVPLAECAASDR